MLPTVDEIVILMSWSSTVVLMLDGAEVPVCLNQPGSYVVVPKGLWHTAHISEPTTMLFMTPGEGTLHADSPPID